MYEYVKMDGKSYPVKFGFNALRHFSRMTGTSINDMERIGQDMTFDTALSLIFCGLKDGARASKEDFILTMDDLGDILDNDMSGIEKCMELFASQMGKSQKKKEVVVKRKPHKKK
tara:strand:+ start:3747 stop:4091 length:345 start_codon:yes stop_codon:yes gene_type:complete